MSGVALKNRPSAWARAAGMLMLLPCFVLVYDAVIVVTSWERLQQTAATLADRLVAEEVSPATDLATDFRAAEEMARPDDLSRDGGIIVSALQRDAAGSSVVWQRRNNAGRTASSFGPPGGPPSATIGADLGAGPLIGAEVLAPISPWVVGKGWFGALVPQRLHAAALRRAARV